MLKRIKHQNLNIKLLVLSSLLISSQLIFLNCGKRKPPLPPVERVSQKVSIEGFQRGGKVFITWQMPARNADDSSVLNIDRADIYRLAQPTSNQLNLTEDDFSKLSTLIHTVPISEADFGMKRLTYTDELEFAGQSARLIYAVRLVNKSGQKASFSNFILIEPAAKVADAPAALTAELTETAVTLRWMPPQKNVDASTPANILGFNVYRSADQNAGFTKINDTPVTDTFYPDENFEFGQDYRYFIRTVSLGTAGEPVESIESETVEVSPIDNFPPSAPSAITIAAAPNNLSIFFAANPEKDICGYKIYRTENQFEAKENWTLLTSEILDRNTFQDKNVESGKTYFYYIIAIDNAGNVSQPSEIISETAP